MGCGLQGGMLLQKKDVNCMLLLHSPRLSSDFGASQMGGLILVLTSRIYRNIWMQLALAVIDKDHDYPRLGAHDYG